MSDYSCGAVELNNGRAERIKAADFLDWILVYGPHKTHSSTSKGRPQPADIFGGVK